MSTLVLQLPERPRLRAGSVDEPRRQRRAGASTPTRRATTASSSRRTATPRQRCCRIRSVVIAVVQDADVSWHRITLPKAPASRLRAALVGVLEEALLDDADAVHLAVAPLATAGQPTWVAAVDKAWLQDELGRAREGDIFVDRVVPMAWPDDPPAGHFHAPAEGVGSVESALLTWASVDGVARSASTAAWRARSCPSRRRRRRAGPQRRRPPPRPSTGSARRSTCMPTEQRLLQAGRSLWNLRQFDLARRTRGARAVRDWARQLMSPAWRPVRIGVALLVAAQIVGLNLWAWHQKSAVESRRAAIQALVKKTFPQRRRRRHPARRRCGDAARDADAAARSPARPVTPISSRCCRPRPRPGPASARRSRTCATRPAS